jgi:hypothetical protein
MDLAFEEGDFESGVAMLSAFGHLDRETASSGCDVIWELATNVLKAAKLGEAGACEVVVNAQRAWGTADEKLAWNGCSAAANLAIESEANRARLGAAGAREVVLEAMRT